MVTIKTRPRPESQFVDVFDENQVQKAIMYRKAKFDEGAEKVQSQINQLGQIPTITEEDAKIVQDKITNLTSNINSIAGLDLSNQFNINKVSSMSSEIVDDPTVQAAVSSARNLQKNQKYMEEARQNPKKFGNVLAVQNEDDFNNQLTKYKQARAEGKDSIFSYSYKPYTDLQGELGKKMEKIKADIEMGMAGDYFTKDEVITPDKIKNLAYSMISSEPKYQDQMRINSTFATKGITDEQLLMQKNRFQIADIREKERDLERERNRLYNIDLSNPKQTAELVKNYKDKVAKYEEKVKFLQDNPNKLINIDTGEVLANKSSREQLAYELSSYALANNLASTFSKNNRTLSVNAAVLKRDELDWNKRMDDIDNKFKERELFLAEQKSVYDQELKSLEPKSRIKVDEYGVLNYSTPEPVSEIKDPVGDIESKINVQKNEARNILKDAITTKIKTIMSLAGGGGITQRTMDELINSMVRPDGTIVDINDNNTIKIIQAKAKQNTNIPIDEKYWREALKYVHMLKKEVDQTWSNDKVMSGENLEVLTKYNDSVHQISALQAMKNTGLSTALQNSGVTPNEYTRLLNEKAKAAKTGNDYTTDAQGRKLKSNYRYSMSQKDDLKLKEIEEKTGEYYKKRIATTKMYPVINFNPEGKIYYDVKTAFTSAIKNGAGLDVTGTASLGKIYGKVDKWSDIKDSDAEIFPTSYDGKNGIVTATVKSGKGSEATSKTYNFYVNPTQAQKFITPEMKQAYAPMNYDDVLDISDNGKLQALVNRRSVNSRGQVEFKKQLEDVYKIIPTSVVALEWKAERINPKDVNDKRIFAYVKFPVNNQMTIVKLNGDFSNTYSAQNLIQKLANDHVDRLPKNLTDLQKKQSLANFLQTINGK